MKFTIICKKDEESFQLMDLLKQNICLEESTQFPDLVIAIGGDGTFIEAIHSYPNAVVFGLHTGHLGFYSNYTKEDVQVLIDDINNRCYQIEYLDGLCCKIDDDKPIVAYALNEMTIIMPPRTLILDVWIDDVQLETFRGTGFCISTAYGSTAYNKSLHGAVVDPCLKAFQLTEIAGINSNQYRTLSSPILLSDNKKVKLCAMQEEEVYVTIDNKSYSLHSFKQAQISLEKEKFKVAYHKKPHFVDRIKRTFIEKNSIR